MSNRFRIITNIVSITNLDNPGNSPMTFSAQDWRWATQFAKAAFTGLDAVKFVIAELDLPWIEARTLLLAAAEHVGADGYDIDVVRHAPAVWDLYFNKKTGLLHELREIGGVSGFLYFGPGSRWVGDSRTSSLAAMRAVPREFVDNYLVYVDPILINNSFLELESGQNVFWVKPEFQVDIYSKSSDWPV